MTYFRAALLLSVLTASLAISTSADAKRDVFRGCAYWSIPFCVVMRATDGKVYQLVGVPPSFPLGTRATVVGKQVGDVGSCFTPVARFDGFKLLPPGPCAP